MSVNILISSSAVATFSADDSCGRPPNRKDMVCGVEGFGGGVVECFVRYEA